VTAVLFIVGCALICGWVATAVLPVGKRVEHALGAVGYGCAALSQALDHDPGGVASGVFSAYLAWRWWRSGGGDDTKRRLRSAARAFTPVRRSAPVAARAACGQVRP
jgi:hypothetical protein